VWIADFDCGLKTASSDPESATRNGQWKENGTVASPTVVTGTVGKDAHVIGIKILSRALRDAGFNVVELGIHASGGVHPGRSREQGGRHPDEFDVWDGRE
jgi:hypothetical protein